MKKLLSTLLAVLLAVTMLTGMAIPAQAAENDIFNPRCAGAGRQCCRYLE